MRCDNSFQNFKLWLSTWKILDYELSTCEYPPRLFAKYMYIIEVKMCHYFSVQGALIICGILPENSLTSIYKNGLNSQILVKLGVIIGKFGIWFKNCEM